MPTSKGHIYWVRSIPFLAVHLVALGIFFTQFHWKLAVLCFGSYLIRMIAITAGYHRYFSHRAYHLNRFFQFSIALVGAASAQKGPLWWAANHRNHHTFSDTLKDPHSPVRTGFWWSHVGWILSDEFDETHWDKISDLGKYPELVWLDRLQGVVPVIYASLILGIWGGSGLLWGFFLSTVLLWHGTFLINSAAHIYGTCRYRTQDSSRNHFWLALITCGEGWHNNHHAYMSSVRQGFLWWEIDLSYYLVWAMSKIGIAKNLRQPPLDRLALIQCK